MIFAKLFRPKELWSAAKWGSVKHIEDLVAAGHDINAQSRSFVAEGDTPLIAAARAGRVEAIKALIRLGAKTNLKSKDGDTLLTAAVSDSKKAHVIELLLDLGANPDQKDSQKMAALDHAAFDGAVEIVRLLLKKGATPNAGRDGHRTSPVVHCVVSKNLEILHLLIEAGADVNIPHYDNCALSSAALNCSPEFVRALLDAKADVHRKDDSGRTVLMVAVAGGDLKIVQMIVEAGAELDTAIFHGPPETALDIAEDRKRRAIAEYLRSVGAKHASELPASALKPPEETTASWQLSDDSILEAALDPWPPQSGPAKLRVEISPNGHDPTLPFSGTLEYRVASSSDNSETWKPMKRGRKDEENNVPFSDSVILTKGTAFIQFKVHPEWEQDSTVLKDWKFEVV